MNDCKLIVIRVFVHDRGGTLAHFRDPEGNVLTLYRGGFRALGSPSRDGLLREMSEPERIPKIVMEDPWNPPPSWPYSRPASSFSMH